MENSVKFEQANKQKPYLTTQQDLDNTMERLITRGMRHGAKPQG